MGPTGCVTLYISYTKHTGRGQHVKYLLFCLLLQVAVFLQCLQPHFSIFLKEPLKDQRILNHLGNCIFYNLDSLCVFFTCINDRNVK